MNLFKIIKYQLYLLQLENYELGRYFRLLWKKGLWPRGEQRKSLVWTAKARALLLMAVGLHILAGIGMFFSAADSPPYAYIVSIVIWLCLFTFYFLLFTFALLLLWPLDFLAKQIIISRAKFKIRQLAIKLDPGSEAGMTHRRLNVIGIAGSYGKTTMKEMLKQVLGVRFKVLATPESVNTPVGIARWILNKVNEETEIIIVEMGEHYKGDVKEICSIVEPDIAVVTGINEAHLERMKSLQTVTDTIFEIVGNLKPKGLVLLNGDNKSVMGNYQKYVRPDTRVVEYSARGGSAPGGKVESKKYKEFNTEKLGWDVEIEGVGKTFINLLGEYALGNVDAAVKIARELGMKDEDIKKGIEKIKPIEHRLQPIQSAGGVLVIDDAYNGNPEGVKEAIKVLSRFSAKGGSASGGTKRRKVYITPGLVEMGSSAKEIHREIGRQLAGTADVVVLVKNSVTPFIAEAINGSTKNQITRTNTQVIWFNTATEAHASLKDILKPGDVVLFQNDWGDQYI